MEQTSGNPKKTGRSGTPPWLILVLSGVVLLVTFAVCITLLLCFDVIHIGGKDNTPTSAEATPAANEPAPSEATPAPQQDAKPTPEETVVTADPNPDPNPEPAPVPVDEPTAVPTEAPTAVPTAEPTPAPTPEPTAVPTPEPTAAPTPKPTAVPDYFMFGGKKIKTGSTKIDGDSLGISGKKNKLKYIPPEEVENLVLLCPNLEELILDYCYMDDYEPLGSLVKLKTLQLARCGEGSGNAIDDIDWIENLTALKTLKLHYNNISDTTALAALTNLTYLNLGHNQLDDDALDAIGELTNLQKLYLYSNKITDVSALSELSNLKFIHLGYNSKLKSVKPLTSLKKLAYLRIGNTKVSDLSYFGKFTALKRLDVTKCPIDTNTVYYLQGCTKLEKIMLDMGDWDTYNAILSDLINEGYPVQFMYEWSES